MAKAWIRTGVTDDVIMERRKEDQKKTRESVALIEAMKGTARGAEEGPVEAVKQFLPRVVMIRVRGRDSLEQKIRGRPFFHTDCGVTTLSASGILVDSELGLILTTATLFLPFASHLARNVVLGKHTTVEVLLHNQNNEKSEEQEETIGVQEWQSSELLGVHRIAEVCEAAQRLTAGYSGWELGWNGVVAAAPTLSPPPPSFIGGSTAVEKGRTSNFQAKGGKGDGGAEGGEHDYEAKVPPPWADAGNLGSIALLQLSSHQRSSSPSPTSSIAAATTSHHHHPDLPNGWISAKALSRGESMMTIGSPYGLLSPNAFLNCVSAGALSNKVTCTDVTGGLVVPLLLTDTRCLPGMEGGAVIDPCGQWVGMLTPPLYRRDGSPVELNIILTADVLLPIVHCYFSPSFLRTKGTSSVTNSLPPENVSHADVASYALPRPTSTNYTGNDRTTNSNHNTLQPSQRKKVLPVAIRRAHWSLVLVTVGNTWASGIIISNNGYVLTNAHVIRPYLNISHPTEGSSEQQVSPQLRAGAQLRVRVDFPLLSSSSASSSFPFYPADVVFVSPTANPDIALLKLSLPDDIASLPAVALCKTAPKEGQKAFILGHAIFGPSTELRASCTKGIVSKVVYVKQRPVLIQTSAAVHSGNSGGMLLDIKGKLVGVVTCNMKQRTDDTTITIPRLNFSIPIPELLPLFRYVQSSDKDKWKTLISEFNKKREADEEIETDRLWGLSERPLDPAQPFGISKGGSKFLQFMNQLNTPHSSSPATEDDQVRAKL